MPSYFDHLMVLSCKIQRKVKNSSPEESCRIVTHENVQFSTSGNYERGAQICEMLSCILKELQLLCLAAPDSRIVPTSVKDTQPNIISSTVQNRAILTILQNRPLKLGRLIVPQEVSMPTHSFPVPTHLISIC